MEVRKLLAMRFYYKMILLISLLLSRSLVASVASCQQAWLLIFPSTGIFCSSSDDLS